MKSSKKILFENILIILILLIGTALRFYNISKNSLWLDELGEYSAAVKSIPGLIDNISWHLSPPLDYLIMHFFLKLTPHNEFYIRMPAVIFGVGSIYILYLLGKKLFSVKIGLISAFLLSISPYGIQYSQEARMYSAFVFFTLISFYAFINFTNFTDISENSNPKLRWYLWILSGISLIYIHYFGFFVLLIQFIVILNSKSKNPEEKLYLKIRSGFLIIGFSFLFWLDKFIGQYNMVSGILPYGMNDNWRNFFWYPLLIFSGLGTGMSTYILLMLIFLMLFDLYKFKSKNHELIIIWVALPLIILFIMTVIKGPVTSQRNLIFLLPGFLFLFSLGISKVSETIFLIARKKLNINIILIFFICLIVFLTLPSLSKYYNNNYEKENWRNIGVYLSSNTNTGDSIIVLGGSPQYLDIYYKGNATYLKPYTIEEFNSDILEKKNGCVWVFYSGYPDIIWGAKEMNKKIIIETLNNTYKIKIEYYLTSEVDGLYKICRY